MKCPESHYLDLIELGVLQGRVRNSVCAVCSNTILRAEKRYMCVQGCAWTVCVQCGRKQELSADALQGSGDNAPPAGARSDAEIRQMHPGSAETKFLKVPTAGITLAYETFGDKGGKAVLLMEGVGADMTIFPVEEFVNPLVELGCYVIRYDHRDNGQSHYFTDAPVSIVQVGLKQIVKDLTRGWIDVQNTSPYTLQDMAKDAVELLDMLDVKHAHIVGHSMGGMIAQEIGITYPDRVLSLTIMSSCPGPGAGPVKASLMEMNAINNKEYAQFKPDEAKFQEIVESKTQYYRAQSGTMWTQEWHEKANTQRVKNMTRGYAAYLQGSERHCAAVVLARDRAPGLKTLRTNGMTGPVLAIHGRLDPIMPPANAELFSSYVSGSHIELIEGMGHIIVPEACEQIVSTFVRYVLDTNIAHVFDD